MKKVKLKIKGMHCQSCSTLIEEKLKTKDGIIRPKVSHESEKGVVVYDEAKIDEKKILELINSIGDYSAELEQSNGNIGSTMKESSKEPLKEIKKNINSFYNNSFVCGIFAGISIISIILNIILLAIIISI